MCASQPNKWRTVLETFSSIATILSALAALVLSIVNYNLVSKIYSTKELDDARVLSQTLEVINSIPSLHMVHTFKEGRYCFRVRNPSELFIRDVSFVLVDDREGKRSELPLLKDVYSSNVDSLGRSSFLFFVEKDALYDFLKDRLDKDLEKQTLSVYVKIRTNVGSLQRESFRYDISIEQRGGFYEVVDLVHRFYDNAGSL